MKQLDKLVLIAQSMRIITESLMTFLDNNPEHEMDKEMLEIGKSIMSMSTVVKAALDEEIKNEKDNLGLSEKETNKSSSTDIPKTNSIGSNKLN